MTKQNYDVLVIGAGPGGYVAAIRAAQLGLSTACVDARETLGGTCLNVGCIPSKALLHASEHFEQASTGALKKFGVDVSDVSLNLKEMHAEKDKTVDGLTKGIDFLFKKNGVTRLTGQAKFVDQRTVLVDGKKISAKNIIIATGSLPKTLAGLEVNQKTIVDSTRALSLEGVPKHLVVVGGGVIGLELGSVWRRLGAKVTIVEYESQILPGFDVDVRKTATRIFKKQGFDIRAGCKVTGAAAKSGETLLDIEVVKTAKSEQIKADIVLVAIGRHANTDGLDISMAGLKANAQGQIEVDADGRTSAEGIWAIGDVTPGAMLAHRAEDEGISVAEIIAGQPGGVNHDLIPGVVYTAPEIASIGLTEEQAKNSGAVKVGKFNFSANSRAKASHQTDGFVKVIADAETSRIVGVHIIGSLAGTMIAQAVQAMEFGASLEDIAYTCHAHPTHSEALKEAAMAALGGAIHA